ncbi:MAG: hypothetical protein ABUT20_59625 [Bacteroidota bacterium]
MSNPLFFIRQYSNDQFFHGGVGYADAEKILQNKNFNPIEFPCYLDFSFTAKFRRFYYLVKLLFSIPKGSCIVFLFPVFAKMNRLLIRLLGRRKDIRLICFLADIDGIKDGDEKLLAQEIRQFKRYDQFIVHNDSMAEWLQKQTPSASIVSISFFDFLVLPFDGNREKSYEIVFAGNLEKSEFLQNLSELNVQSPLLHFNLYGPGLMDDFGLQANVDYRGIFKPSELPGKLKGSFGLVWDGDSIGEPAGSLGNYMRYISHHKLSLYIVSGLPLIVPEMAASAVLVRKFEIGFTITSLDEIQEKINDISSERYQQMRENMKPLADKISRGNCLGSALEELFRNVS